MRKPPLLAWPGNALLDDMAAQIGVDQPLSGAMNGIHKTGIVDAVLSRKLRQGSGFENPHSPALT
jgi:hypothetical protein